MAKILLVDDTKTVLMFEQMMLSGLGHEIQTAANGKEAIAAATKEIPDLILMDIVMPEMDGVEACSRLRADPRTKAVPIVMITTKGQPEMVEKAFQAGCNDFLTKPVDKVELLNKVQKCLGKKG